ncbi:ATPase domain-containing protein [Halorubrum vacuolatum]|uniref:non-specific serine/threonine protein kinase n=1 Tax=Halorubrum vacuolatum TaxID=63740 RepID=A0A238Y8U0_HALVU|nr:ATPase domain-containing protein [Halorubrum vacuolatum]SNR67258.1 circadian clock protein KaiC [Halorubrum vacuolatum]
MTDSRIHTGVPRADEVLMGGLLPESATLLRGAPGAGKTIFGLHFLTTRTDPDATNLYINLGEPKAYLESTARGFGLNLDAVEFLDRSPAGETFQEDSTYTLFASGEVEQPSLVGSIREVVEAVEPERVVIDPVTVLRHLAPDTRQFRRQVLSLLDFLKSMGTTTLLTSQAATSLPDDDLQFLADTVVTLDNDMGHRTLSVSKFRGSSSRDGAHTVTIDDDGMQVWPRLDPTRHRRERPTDVLPSGVAELDRILDGGIATGTVTFLSGPAGVGKTTTGLQFLSQAARAGDRAVVYSFEEGRRTMLARADAVGIPLREAIDDGTVSIVEIGPDELSLDAFTHRLRTEVEEAGAEVVMLDGVGGYERAFRGHQADVTRQLIKIGRYLRNMNVTGLVTNEVHQITGEFRATEQQVSHLADGIIILRHVEYKGRLQKCIGVVKMRSSAFETGLRTLDITADGLQIGEELSGLRGVLTGTPNWHDDA